jgi:hypothetical protein
MVIKRPATWPELVHEFPRGEEICLPEHTHFIALEDPDLVASRLRSILERLS